MCSQDFHCPRISDFFCVCNRKELCLWKASDGLCAADRRWCTEGHKSTRYFKAVGGSQEQILVLNASLPRSHLKTGTSPIKQIT